MVMTALTKLSRGGDYGEYPTLANGDRLSGYKGCSFDLVSATSELDSFVIERTDKQS